MAAKRTPLGHKRRGEAKIGILPVGGEGPGGRKIRYANGSVGKVHRAILAKERVARGPDGEGPPTAPGGALPQRIFNARHETTSTQTWSGKRGFVQGLKVNPQLNPDNSQRASWGTWRPGGG
jgi:hypothetical protein